MADNVVLNAGTGGATLATDEITGPRHVQFVKLMDGTADSAAIIAGDATNGLDVDPTRFPVDRVATGTLTAAGQTVAINKESGEGVVGIQLTGTWVATVEFEGTVDGTTWVALNVHNGTALVVNTTGNGVFVAPAGHFDQVRVRASAYTSGTVNVSLLSCRGVSATVVVAALPAGTNNIGDIDVLTVPAPLSTTGGGVEATALRVTLANDSTGLVSVDDNGGSLTGDVAGTTAHDAAGAGVNPVPIGGYASAAAPADVSADTDVVRAWMLRNGATATVITAAGALIGGDAANGLDVDVTRFAAGAITEVQGDVAHDAAAAGNPVLLGARANANEPTAVSADGDATHLWADLLGRLVVLPGHPNPEAPVTANGSAAGVSVIAAPGASLSLYICKGSVHNSAAAEQIVSLRDGAAGTIRWTANLAADGGGSLFDFGARGWKLTANTAFVMDAAAATAYINVTEYYVAP